MCEYVYKCKTQGDSEVCLQGIWISSDINPLVLYPVTTTTSTALAAVLSVNLVDLISIINTHYCQKMADSLDVVWAYKGTSAIEKGGYISF